MADPRYAAHRFLLKDTIRQQIDFSQTAQSRGLPPPPQQQPCAPDLPRIPLPDGRTTPVRPGSGAGRSARAAATDEDGRRRP